MVSISHERLFVHFYQRSVDDGYVFWGKGFPDGVVLPMSWEASDVGRRQFLDHQSDGAWPEWPDPFFLVLEAGKRQVDLLTSDNQKSYVSEAFISPWWGLAVHWHDWKGERWVLPFLFSWWEKEHRLKWARYCERYHELRDGFMADDLSDGVYWGCMHRSKRYFMIRRAKVFLARFPDVEVGSCGGEMDHSLPAWMSCEGVAGLCGEAV